MVKVSRQALCEVLDYIAAPPHPDDSASGSAGAMREALAAWFDVEIEAAKEKQIDGFKTATEQGQLAGERAHARQCALYEAKRVVTAALAAPQAQESHTCRPQYKMRELPDPDCKACTTVTRPHGGQG